MLLLVNDAQVVACNPGQDSRKRFYNCDGAIHFAKYGCCFEPDITTAYYSDLTHTRTDTGQNIVDVRPCPNAKDPPKVSSGT